ncbi:hypothetical protein C6501_18685 [Candidatus Poribacteria bacterium]|nr:MAG: hypothetical protein C6501_18685 [Candidatus Poribacteria bacterium]
MFRFCLLLCIFIVLIGCQPPEKTQETPGNGDQTQEPTISSVWSYASRTEGYDMLGVQESKEWLNKNKDKFDIPESTDYRLLMGTGLPKFTDAILITKDDDGNIRVGFDREEQVTPKTPKGTQELVFDGYLSAGESRQWLSNNGYEVIETTSGIQIKKERPGHSINTKLDGNVIGYPLPEGRTLIVSNGKIYVSDEK